jgi:hypothetical protein
LATLDAPANLDDCVEESLGESLGESLLDLEDTVDTSDSMAAQEAAARQHAKERQRDASKKQAGLAAWRCRWCQCQIADTKLQVAGPDGEGTLCEMCGDKFSAQQAERAEKERIRLAESERLERQKKDKAAAAAAAAAAVQAQREVAMATMKANLAADLASIEVSGEDGLIPQLAPSLAMSVEDWLGIHGAADCAPNFRADAIETLEDAALMLEESDLAELGVTSEQAALLWPIVVAAQNGDLSTVGTTEAPEGAETLADEDVADTDPFAALGEALASTPEAEVDQDPFAALQQELDAGMPSSLY